MPYTRREDWPVDGTDITRIGPNIYWNEALYQWDTLDHNKDTFVIDIVSVVSGTSYISVQHAPATTGEPVFTEWIRIDASAALDISSTTGALIAPRMTTTQRDALTPVNGMIIYNTTTNLFNFYENGGWVTKN